jgi:magnesium transporter
VPTREDVQEIEISSRLYIENGARYMTASPMCAADNESPRITPVTFIMVEGDARAVEDHAARRRLE